MAVGKMVTVEVRCSTCKTLIEKREVLESKVPLKEQRISHSLCKKCRADQGAELEQFVSQLSKK